MPARQTDDFGHQDRCAIVGIGSTEFSRNSQRSVLTLATEASSAALADAGLSPNDVDGIVRCDHDHVTHNDLVCSLGIPNLTYQGQVGPGGVGPCAMVGQAVAAILSGQATTVLLYRSLNGRSEVRFGSGTAGARDAAATVGGQGTYDEFFLPFGLMTAGQTFSVMAQRHMIEYGTTCEQLGSIAIACREQANFNPAAQMHSKPLDMQTYLASRMISTPLRLYDYCLESDGACAVVVTSANRASDTRKSPVLIRAVAQGSPPDTRGGMMFPIVMRDNITDLPAYSVASTLYARAGLGPDEIDVAQLYDCFSISILLQLEAYGFCEKGEGGPFAESGAIRRGGTLPINTGGGHLSEGYIHGMNHVVEGVRQMRGDSSGQVPHAETCLVTGGPLPTGSAVILRKS